MSIISRNDQGKTCIYPHCLVDQIFTITGPPVIQIYYTTDNSQITDLKSLIFIINSQGVVLRINMHSAGLNVVAYFIKNLDPYQKGRVLISKALTHFNNFCL